MAQGLEKVRPGAVDQGELETSARLGADIREIWRITSGMVGEPEDEGVTIDQYWILRFLYDAGPKPIKDIAAEVGVSHSPATISVKRLEGRHLVRRVRGHEDERIVTVSLTERGRKLFEGWRKGRRKELRSLFDSLDGQEKGRLLELLDKVLLSRKK